MNLLKRLRAPHNDAGAGAPEPPGPAVEDSTSVEPATAPASPSTRLRAQADRRIDDAVAEGLDQLRNGWRTHEVLAVLADAAATIADLREQAVEAEEAEAAAAAYGRMIGADLSLEERRRRGREITESLEASNAYWATHERVEATS
jgi:hypothetical protein